MVAWVTTTAFSPERLSTDEQALVQAFLTTLEPLIAQRKSDGTVALLTFEELYAPLSSEQRALCDWIRSLSPQQLGHQSRPVGRSPAHTEFTRIADQTYIKDGQPTTLEAQHLPREVFDAYQAMTAAMARDVGRKLLVESGYRSPAYQLYVFLQYLPKHGYSVRETNRFVALPGFSEHGAPQRQAIDFINEQGINGEDHPEEFEALPEYEWLTQHAREYGFYLSYPRDNPWDTSFEPWHWHYHRNTESPRTGQ